MTPTEFREALKRLRLTQSEAARRMYAADLRGLSRTETAKRMIVYRIKIWRWYHGVTRIPGEITALLECWEKTRKDA